jgi:hypothetical protein
LTSRELLKHFIIVVALLLVGLAAIAAWQVGSVYLAHIEHQSDLKDLSSLTGMRIGLVNPRSDDEIKDLVIAKAEERGIHLEPEQIYIERIGEGIEGEIYLSTEYDVHMDVLGFPWTQHFTAAGPRR